MGAVYWGMPGQPLGDASLEMKEKLKSMERSFPGLGIEWYKCVKIDPSENLDDFKEDIVMGITPQMDFYSYENFASLQQEHDDAVNKWKSFERLFLDSVEEARSLRNDIEKQRSTVEIGVDTEMDGTSTQNNEILTERNLQSPIQIQNDAKSTFLDAKLTSGRPAHINSSFPDFDQRHQRRKEPDCKEPDCKDPAVDPRDSEHVIENLMFTNDVLREQVAVMKDQFLEAKKRCSDSRRRCSDTSHSEINLASIEALAALQNTVKELSLSNKRRGSLPVDATRGGGPYKSHRYAGSIPCLNLPR